MPLKKMKRNAAASRESILKAALKEFSTVGYAGARVDNIAQAAGISKPLIYTYFGDKDAVYAAALREAYVQIRESEKQLNFENLESVEAIRSLVAFTLEHFRNNPWFIIMLNTENLRGGEAIRKIHDVEHIQSHLVKKLGEILAKGEKEGKFRAGIDPVELYVFIASVCYFPVSNVHTLRAVFAISLDDDWLDSHGKRAAEFVVRYLRPL